MLWQVLTKFGGTPHILTMIREFHDAVKVRVDISGEESNPFKVLAGAKLTSRPILSANVFRVYFYSFDVARDARIEIRLR